MCLSVYMFHLWYYWTDFFQILCVKSCHVNLLLDRISPGFPTPMKLRSNLNVFFSAFSDHKNNYVQHKYISYWGVELVWNIFYMACNLWSTKKHKFWVCNTWVWTCYNRFVWAINGKTTFAKYVYSTRVPIFTLVCYRWRYWLDRIKENRALSVRLFRNVIGLLLKAWTVSSRCLEKAGISQASI